MIEEKKKPLNPGKFTWEEGQIRIIKRGGKPVDEEKKPVKPKKE